MLGHTRFFLFKKNEETCGIIVIGWPAWPQCQGEWAGRRVRLRRNLTPWGQRKTEEIWTWFWFISPETLLDMDFLVWKPINPLCCVWGEFPVTCSTRSLKRYSFIAEWHYHDQGHAWNSKRQPKKCTPAAWLQGAGRQICGLHEHFSERLSRTFGEGHSVKDKFLCLHKKKIQIEKKKQKNIERVCDLSKLEISGKVGSYNMCVTLIMEYLAHVREWIRLKFISSPRSPCPITALATLEKGLLVRLTSPCCCRGSHGSNRYPSSLSSITSSRRISPFLAFLLVWGAACVVGWPGISSSKLWARSLFVSVSVCAQSCLTLCDPMDYRSPGSTVLGIFQSQILEWVAISSSPGDLPDPGIEPTSPALTGRFFTTVPPGKPLVCRRVTIYS